MIINVYVLKNNKTVFFSTGPFTGSLVNTFALVVDGIPGTFAFGSQYINFRKYPGFWYALEKYNEKKLVVLYSEKPITEFRQNCEDPISFELDSPEVYQMFLENVRESRY